MLFSKKPIMSHLKKYFTFSNIVLACFFFGLFYLKYPQFKHNFESEGVRVEPQFSVTDLGSNLELVFPSNKKQVIIFWATWCAPCKVELGRLNGLVSSAKIKPEQVLAVSTDNQKEDVLKFLKESNYKFQVAHDSDGQLREFFKIEGTPTLILLDEVNVVAWRTTGISPSLELRLLSFLNESNSAIMQ